MKTKSICPICNKNESARRLGRFSNVHLCFDCFMEQLNIWVGEEEEENAITN